MIDVIQLGDCLQVMRTMPDHSVDLILCDLPYGTTQNAWDSPIALSELWEAYVRVAKLNAAIVLTANQPFTSTLIVSNRKWFKYAMVWEKSLKTNFLNAKKQPLRAHEDVLVFYDKQCTYNPQGLRSGAINGGNGLTGSYGKWKPRSATQQFTGYPTTIIRVPNPNQGNIHPTQKPVPLFELLILTYSNPGDLVLDNCIGSGTTAIAAINTGRHYLGIESDERYYKMATARVQTHLARKQNKDKG